MKRLLLMALFTEGNLCRVFRKDEDDWIIRMGLIMKGIFQKCNQKDKEK